MPMSLVVLLIPLSFDSFDSNVFLNIDSIIIGGSTFNHLTLIENYLKLTSIKNA
jgi:hypothetical protein